LSASAELLLVLSYLADHYVIPYTKWPRARCTCNACGFSHAQIIRSYAIYACCTSRCQAWHRLVQHAYIAYDRYAS